jgi:hypothetical protein
MIKNPEFQNRHKFKRDDKDKLYIKQKVHLTGAKDDAYVDYKIPIAEVKLFEKMKIDKRKPLEKPNRKGELAMSYVAPTVRKAGTGSKLRRKALNTMLKNRQFATASHTVHPATEHMNKKYGAQRNPDKDGKYYNDDNDPDGKRILSKGWTIPVRDYLTNMKLADPNHRLNALSKSELRAQFRKRMAPAKSTKGRGMAGKKA